MSTLTASCRSSIPRHLHVTEKTPQDSIFDEYVWSDETCHVGGLKFGFAGSRRPQTRLRLDKRTRWAYGLRLTRLVLQFDVPSDQDVFEVLRLIRSWENNAMPINRIPPEILSTIPDFWDTRDGVVALTHVCRAWREVFVSRPSLWTDLDCVDSDKTCVYLERSKSSPIDLWLDRKGRLSPHDPLFQIIPHAIGRLKSLHIDAKSGWVQSISAHLSRPAPLLEKLSIRSKHHPELASTLFGGDLSPLRKLHLRHVRTELPWRNMVNLTSFMLAHAGPVSVGQLLDFFEGAPHLREVSLLSWVNIPGAQGERSVSLACLKRMYAGGCPFSHLFNHLLVPVGARLTMEVDLPSPPIEGLRPRFIDNLRNLSHFTTIKFARGPASMQFSGPSGEVWMIHKLRSTCSELGSLACFDTSRTERVEIESGNSPTSDSLHRALLPMDALHTLVLTRCETPHTFVHALHPSMRPSGVLVCPRLEELVIEHGEMFDIKNVVETVAARASRGVKLKIVRIISRLRGVDAQLDVSELKKHVLHVDSRCGQQ